MGSGYRRALELTPLLATILFSLLSICLIISILIVGEEATKAPAIGGRCIRQVRCLAPCTLLSPLSTLAHLTQKTLYFHPQRVMLHT